MTAMTEQNKITLSEFSNTTYSNLKNVFSYLQNVRDVLHQKIGLGSISIIEKFEETQEQAPIILENSSLYSIEMRKIDTLKKIEEVIKDIHYLSDFL